MRHIALVVLLAISSTCMAFQPRTGHWWNPAESGRGFNIDIQNGVMVMTMYAYDAAGNAQWYLATATMTNEQHDFTATLDKYAGGQCVTCTYRAPSVTGNDGVVSVDFTSEITANVTLPSGHVSSIVPLNFKYGDPPQGLLGEWVYVYDIITTFADRFDYATIRGATPTGNGTVWDDVRDGACELQVSGALAGQVACFQFAADGSASNAYLYTYGVDETFSGSWISLATNTLFVMKGFRIKGESGFSKAKIADDQLALKFTQARSVPGPATDSSAALLALGKAMFSTRK